MTVDRIKSEKIHHALGHNHLLKRLVQLVTHGLLGLVLILPPLLGNTAHSADLQINSANTQTQSVLNQNLNNNDQKKVASQHLDKVLKPRIARQQRDQIAIQINDDSAATGMHLLKESNGNVAIVSNDAMIASSAGGIQTLSDVNNSGNAAGGAMEPAVIMMILSNEVHDVPAQSRVSTATMDNHVIRINAATARK